MFSEHVQSMSGRAKQKAATNRQVLAAAEELFIAQGYERTSIRQIAQAAGVSVGTVAGCGDKKALLIAVFVDWISGLHQPGHARQYALAQSTLSGALYALLEPALDRFLSNSQLTKEAMALLILSDGDEVWLNELADYLETDAEYVLARFLPASSDLASLGGLVYHLYLGVLVAWALGRYSDAQVETVLRTRIDQFAMAIHPTPQPHKE